MQTRNPIIGICSPTSNHLAYNRQNWSPYVEAVRAAGGHVLELPLGQDPATLPQLLQQCQGFLLPGSLADMNPERYGEERHPQTAPADAAREKADFLVLEHAEASGKPVLGICYGLQSLNVWRGGTLVQDLQPLPVNHAAGASVAIAHSASIVPASLLGSLASQSEAPQKGQFRRLPVNSSHHQAASRVGKDLTVVARCPEDGVVEALEGRIGNSAMLAVQWHPERSTAISAASRNVFLWLALEAADVLGSSIAQESAGQP